MKPSRLLFPLLGLSLLAPAGAGLAPRAWAQPQAPAEIAEVQGEWDKLRAATAELEATDAVAAIERYQKFYESRGRFDMRVSIQLSSLIAQLYWRELGNRDKAIEIYDWAIPLFGGHYDSPRLTRERALLVEGTTPLAAPVVIAPVSKTSVAQAKAAEPIRLGMGGKGAIAPGVAAKTTGTAMPATAMPGAVTIASPVSSTPTGNAPAAVVLPPFLSVAPPKTEPQSVAATPNAVASAPVEPIRLEAKAGGVAAGVAAKTVVAGVVPDAALPAPAGPLVLTLPLAAPQIEVTPEAVVLPPFLSVGPRSHSPQTVAVTPLANAATSPASVVSPAMVTAHSMTATPASVVSPTMVAAPAMAATPATVAAPAMNAVAAPAFSEVNVRSAVVAVLLAQMRSGALTPEEAWQNGDLKAEDVLYALQTPGVTDAKAKSDAPLRIALAGVLVRHAPQQLAPLTASAPLTLVLADYYASVRDAKAVPLYEQLLAQVKAPVSTAPTPALKQLVAFYQSVGDYGQAADTLLRMEKFTTMGAYRGNVGVEAARLYRQAGDETKAAASYARVAREGYGWATGLALYDQASVLVGQGKYEEARKLLLQPVEGQYADQMKVATLSLLSLSYYKTGEFEQARRYAQQCLAQAASMKLLRNEGLEATVNVAEAVQSWNAQWEKTPLAVADDNIHIVLVPQEPSETLLTRRLLVRTLRDVPLVATVDDTRIQVRVTNDKQENDYFVQKEIAIEVPHSLAQGVDAMLMVSSPQFPDYQARVPLHVEVPKPIQLSSSSVFFGEVKANEPTTRKLTLSAAVPFRVVDVKTDTTALEVQSPAPQAAKEQIITLIFTSPQVGRFYSGIIRIQTDMSNEEVIETHYFAWAK